MLRLHLVDVLRQDVTVANLVLLQPFQRLLDVVHWYLLNPGLHPLRPRKLQHLETFLLTANGTASDHATIGCQAEWVNSWQRIVGIWYSDGDELAMHVEHRQVGIERHLGIENISGGDEQVQRTYQRLVVVLPKWRQQAQTWTFDAHSLCLRCSRHGLHPSS